METKKSAVRNCSRCFNHGITIQTKGHFACKFLDCHCDLCVQTANRRKIMSEYIKRRRQIERKELINALTKNENEKESQTEGNENFEEIQNIITQMHKVFGSKANLKIQEWINIGEKLKIMF
jgi:hypothetical protein